jgi:hypothetical protein
MKLNIRINDLIRESTHNVVSVVKWEGSLIKDGMFESANYKTTLPYKNSNNSSFILFENLTETKIIEWVKEDVNTNNILENLEKKIDDRKKAQKIFGLPWNIYKLNT